MATGRRAHPGPGRVVAVGAAVLRYLRKYPQASDACAGICQFWLPGEGVIEAEVVVEAALEDLVERGLMRRIVLRDDTVLYAGPTSGGD